MELLPIIWYASHGKCDFDNSEITHEILVRYYM